MPELLPRVPHGGPGAEPFRGLDFSVNANPYGPNPVLLKALLDADHTHYPDPTYFETRRQLADWHGVNPENVAVSVGASDLLHRLARAFLPVGGTLLSLHAPFGELARAAQLQGNRIEVMTDVPTDLPPNAALVYVGYPHNPTGQAPTPDQLSQLSEQCAASGALLIVDEAYAAFAGLPDPPRHPHLIRLLSPGKAHGLVGARPAYALAAAQLIRALDNLAPAWHVPASTAAVLASLPEAQAFLAQTLPQVRRHAEDLAEQLGLFGAVQHLGTPYLLLKVGNAQQVSVVLLASGIKVRDCTSYDLPQWIRVSARLPGENAALIESIEHLS
ncbi:histidinol-phosphate aminotransferase family protein (plasmid) [Deinococcus psychrotolerans]|uniref:Histidinol-phosphate aminotransferase family protein n=1 Tax=Deinococcus psychrotolerans TaxID=2489213 RepID=A0A3G8YJE5_9DEIO|nr:histidinol-phosphate transaminase [Deinococcus psychrotolerans]AZI45025.1 histidinol-phosphate aminotransferase family protein [Deinococcus psychrotolerans]